MNKRLIIVLSVLFPILVGAQNKYGELPLGAIKADGWLLEQLQRQASGLTGHLDEVYPQVMGESNAWLGGDGDAWERGPYWIDGLLPLAWILDDAALKAKAARWVEAILASQQPDGFIGPAEDHPFVYGLQRGKAHDWWPRMVALKILKQYYQATGDRRVTDCLTKYFHYQLKTLPEKPLGYWSDWGVWRGADNLEVVLWLYDITSDPSLLELAELIHSQTTDWTGLFADGSIFYNQNSIHCVNLAQGFKAPAVWWQISKDAADLASLDAAVAAIRHTVGLPTGLWAGDEQLHWGDPVRGSELCTAVEMMFSLEEILRITGNTRWADYMERVAFNALPAQIDQDFTAKQYYQQANQVSCTRGWREFSTPHDGTDVLFGTLNGYPCCLSNMHQGWPKFTQNLWYSTPDGGLAALVYAPSRVSAKVAGGVEVTVSESTDYPFRESVRFCIGFAKKCQRKAAFPLRFRVPGWCPDPLVTINGEKIDAPVADGIIVLDRTWKNGDAVELTFPMKIATEEWYDKALTVVRGPLVYALKMEENRTWLPFDGPDRLYGPGAWEVTSSTPWNYCIMRDSFTPEACTVVENAPSAYPWTASAAPVSIFIPARTLPHWTDIGSVAYFTEDSLDAGPETRIELIPYGCTTLRISCFPSRLLPWDLDYKANYVLP